MSLWLTRLVTCAKFFQPMIRHPVTLTFDHWIVKVNRDTKCVCQKSFHLNVFADNVFCACDYTAFCNPIFFLCLTIGAPSRLRRSVHCACSSLVLNSPTELATRLQLHIKTAHGSQACGRERRSLTGPWPSGGYKNATVPNLVQICLKLWPCIRNKEINWLTDSVLYKIILIFVHNV